MQVRNVTLRMFRRPSRVVQFDELSCAELGLTEATSNSARYRMYRERS